MEQTMDKTEQLAEKIREAAKRYKGGAPQLKTIARYIEESDTPYIARVERVEDRPSRFGRDSRRRRFYNFTDKGRMKTVLNVYKVHKGETYHAFDYDSTEPHMTNNDVCRWVVKEVMGEVQPTTPIREESE